MIFFNYIDSFKYFDFIDYIDIFFTFFGVLIEVGQRIEMSHRLKFVGGAGWQLEEKNQEKFDDIKYCMNFRIARILACLSSLFLH